MPWDLSISETYIHTNIPILNIPFIREKCCFTIWIKRLGLSPMDIVRTYPPHRLAVGAD